MAHQSVTRWCITGQDRGITIPTNGRATDPPEPTSGGWFRRQVLRNAAAVLVFNGWSSVIALATVPLLLRELGAVVFGIWVLLQTLSALNGWLSLADLGVGRALSRQVALAASAGDTTRLRVATGTGLALFVTLGAIAGFGIAVVGRPFLPDLFSAPAALQPQVRTALLLVGAQAIVDLTTAGLLACAEGLQRVDAARALDAVRRTFVAVGTVAAAATGHGLVGVATASLAGAVAGGAVAGVLVARLLPGRPGRPDRTTARELLRYGAQAGGIGATGVLHRTMDRLIVGAIVGPAAVTLVEIATQVQNGALAFLSASSYPATTASSWLAGRGDRAALRELVVRGTKYCVLVTLSAVVIAAVLSREIVDVWVGNEYRDAAGLIVVALAFVALTAPLAVGSNVLVGTGRARAVLVPSLLTVAVNLIASITLVHLVGIVGAFIGTLIGAAVAVPLLGPPIVRAAATDAWTFLRQTVLPAVPPSIAAGAGAAAILVSPLTGWVELVVAGLVGAAVYAGVAAAVAVRRRELRELGELVRRAQAG